MDGLEGDGWQDGKVTNPSGQVERVAVIIVGGEKLVEFS